MNNEHVTVHLESVHPQPADGSTVYISFYYSVEHVQYRVKTTDHTCNLFARLPASTMISLRTASSCSSPTTKIRWSKPARRRQTAASSRETTLSTESPPQLRRRRTNGSKASSEFQFFFFLSLQRVKLMMTMKKKWNCCPSLCRAAISKDPFYEMLAARKKKVSSLKGL